MGQKPEENTPSTPVTSAPSAAPLTAPATTTTTVTSSLSTEPARTSSTSRNVLSSDVEIKGTVKFTNDLLVDGRIEGEIQSDGSLTVGENARIKAEIKTGSVVVYGKVHGNITVTERIELKASAEVVGDIKAKTLSMEAGAIFVGKSTIGTPTLTTGGGKEGKGDATATKQGTLVGTEG